MTPTGLLCIILGFVLMVVIIMNNLIAQGILMTRDQKINIDGLFISKKLLNKDSNRSCPVCHVYSFDLNDDLYMNRYECCKKCYIKWVEGREERWKTGWRPNENNSKS